MAPSEKTKFEEPKVIVVTNVEIVSNFVWRGIDIGGDMMHRRNGDSYKSVSFAPALQPTIDIFSPSKNFQFQLFGSFQISQRHDRDSDKRLFQSTPGGVGPSYISEEPRFWDPSNQDNCAQNLQTQSLSGNGSFTGCDRIPGQDISPQREPNGMRRADGLFSGFTYHFDEAKWGSLSVGIWFYNTFNKSPAFGMAPASQTPNPYASGGVGTPYSPNVYNSNNTNAITRLSWHEYFIFYKLPVLKQLEPTISLYTQYSTDNGGIMAGRNYISYSMGYEFRKGNFFRNMPSINIGYAAANNLIDNRNGIQDITGSWSFFFGDFFTRITGVYKPDLYIWDTNNAYGYAGGEPNRANWNRTSKDGLVPDPSKLYGAENSFVLNSIESLDFGNAGLNALGKTYLREMYTLQKIPAYILYYSFGYTKTF
ncbi:MAG: hypothetical protein SH817_15785 [Leptospira sp.]|nr:hypothetical protein [Leptospira sp.]